MPEKRVILCEGVHDLYFFSLLLDERRIKHRTVRKEELNRKPNAETHAIRQFINRRKGKGLRYLIKDEGGNLRCIENFTILYEDVGNSCSSSSSNSDSFTLFLCLDGDAGNLDRLRYQTHKHFRKDLFEQKSEHLYLTKNDHRNAVIFIPDSLESQVRAITGKNIDTTSHDAVQESLSDFIRECRVQEIDWFMELEAVLFGDE